MSKPKVFQAKHPRGLSDVARDNIYRLWRNKTTGTELEGSQLILLEEGMEITPVGHDQEIPEADIDPEPETFDIEYVKRNRGFWRSVCREYHLYSDGDEDCTPIYLSDTGDCWSVLGETHRELRYVPSDIKEFTIKAS